MFSGLTNQFTSLVGAVKGGAGDEDVPAPTGEAAAAAPAAAASTSLEATASSAVDPEAAAAAGGEGLEGEEAGKRLPKSSSLVDSLVTEATGWLGSAKGWLGNASIPSMPAMPSMPSMPAMPAMPSIPSIPGLRKAGGAEGAEGAEGAVGEGGAAASGAVSGGEDDDKSRYISATEGADSHPASGGGTPTGDEGQIGQVTTKVTQQAKHFGSFLSSAISKAGSKIKETVKDNTILDSFNKEQEAFIKGQGGVGNGAAPWIGHANEAKIKEEILGLSQDRRNFVRAPPAGVDFEFSYDTAYPTAIAIMAEDKALETMRFELVPKIITEENFWRNYFYRVSLIIQAAELGTLGADGVGQASSGEDANEVATKESKSKTAEPAKSDSSLKAIAEQPKAVIEPKVGESDDVAATKSKARSAGKELGQKISESEFVSDDFQASSESDLAEIQDGMRKLGIDSMTQQALATTDEEQWEKDLEAELKDYEVVDEGGTGGGGHKKGRQTSSGGDDDAEADEDEPTISNLRTRSTNNDWEEYADLIEDTDDLKTLKCLKRTMLGYP
ncbi:synapse-associated protein of 47 kDa isoform X3 [Drosophila eugracilis]|uniref:synapse-associated protein of 47 kDa isoform X3 n=1 Tax=Drosophila eugracilis TaxID=29029 RepID=UPI0007E6DFFD|nr:synapse-associated protein of 47 kDa isoform X3 [Drosophila eugracilis]